MNYNFVGYGSLISHPSMMETIHDRPFTPVMIKGYKRVFNLSIKKSSDSDVLNVEESQNSTFNGVLFQVNEIELKKLMARENLYELKETVAYDFVNGKHLCKCYIVVDSDKSIDKLNKAPNKEYFVLCREAAYKISTKFGLVWDQTTFTAAGQKISDWLEDNNEYDTIGE